MAEVKDSEILFARIKENAIIPSKRDEDAGYDLYPCFEEDFFVIEPHKTRAVPTGIAGAFSKKYYAQVEERGSTGKIGVKKSSGVIDSGYRGEYLIMTYNTNDIPFIISKIDADSLPENLEINGKIFEKDCVIIYPYKKAICQIVMHEVPVLEVKEVSYDELCSFESERGTGKFGSSKK